MQNGNDNSSQGATVPATQAAKVESMPSGYIVFTATAVRQARRAKELDNADLARGLDSAQFLELAGQVIDASLSAVLNACCAMEATINELFLAKQLKMVTLIPGLDSKLADSLDSAWNSGVEKLGILEKAGIIAVVCGRGTLDLSREPFQSARVLVSLRNELVHHKPSWVSMVPNATASPDKLERALATLVRPAAVWQGRDVGFRWNGCLGGDCADWAAKTAKAVCQEVYAMAGAKLPQLHL